MVGEAVRLSWRFPGAAHPDEVWSEASAQAGEERNDVPPHVRRSGVAVKKDDRIAVAGVDVTDVRVEHICLLTGMRVEARRLSVSDHECPLLDPPHPSRPSRGHVQRGLWEHDWSSTRSNIDKRRWANSDSAVVDLHVSLRGQGDLAARIYRQVLDAILDG